jgi:hypothetical protein
LGKERDSLLLRKCEFLILNKWFRKVHEHTATGKTGQYFPTGRIELATPRTGILGIEKKNIPTGRIEPATP